MDSNLQHIILIARTIQGVTPIFIEYALWIALAGLAVFTLGEIFARLLGYQDRQAPWIAKAFGVHEKDLLPIPSAYLLGMETVHPNLRTRNPFGVRKHEPSSHKADYIVRGETGAAIVSVYNWRGTGSLQDFSDNTPGKIRSTEIRKSTMLTGFKKVAHRFSPDEDTKLKSATLSAALVTKFGSRARISALCLHKNRPSGLVTRSPRRDVHGRTAAHIDVEQIKAHRLPCGNGGQIDEETWRDLRRWILRQPARMTGTPKTAARVLTLLALLAVYSLTESKTISPFEIQVLQEYLAEGLAPGMETTGMDTDADS